MFKNNNKFQKAFTLLLKYNLNIKVNTTPNPNFLKFVPVGQTVMLDGSTLDIVNEKYANISPLAQKMFQVKGVNRVFYAKDYISISKTEDSDWNQLKPSLVELIKEQFLQKQVPLLLDSVPQEGKQLEEDDEVVQMIKEIIDTRIRPMVQDDGGDVVFRRFDENTGIVTLSMMGSCSGCPSSQVTLKNGIEKMIMHYVPEVSGVESEDYQGGLQQ